MKRRNFLEGDLDMPAGEVNETQDEEKRDHIGDNATIYHVIKSQKK